MKSLMMHRNHESDKNSAMITDIELGLIWEANLEYNSRFRLCFFRKKLTRSKFNLKSKTWALAKACLTYDSEYNID